MKSILHCSATELNLLDKVQSTKEKLVKNFRVMCTLVRSFT